MAKLTKDYNLAALYPDIAKEWHKTKNGKSEPYDFTPGSHFKASWICYRNHEWTALIKDRVRGTSCPYCFSSKTSKLELLLLSELSWLFNDADHRGKVEGLECDILIPSIKMGVEYDGSYWHKNKLEKDKIKNKKLKSLNFDLIRVREEPLKIITRRDIIHKNKDSDEELLIKLFKKIRLNDNLNKKQIKKIDRYILEGKLVNIEYFNELKTRLPRPPKNKTLEYLYPKIAKQWNYKKNYPLTPEDIPPKSNEKFWWICKNNHSIHKEPYHRLEGPYYGCGFCSGRHATKENNFMKSFPHLVKELAIEKNDIDLSTLTPQSEKELWWKCKKNHLFQQQVKHRAIGQGCPYCSNQKVGYGNDFQSQYPKIAKEWHPTKNGKLKPNQVISKSKKLFYFLCKNGHTYKQSLQNKVKQNQGCPYCSGRYATEEKNLKTLFPEIAKEWHPTKNGDKLPTDFLPVSGYKAFWLCENGHSYQRWIEVRTRKPSIICPICKKNDAQN
jgi:hypothetical protein